MDKEQLIKTWKEFADKFGVKLNPDNQVVQILCNGVLNNEINKGMKYCPCRMTTGRREDDLKLICPCNFKAQKGWQEKGECWCSLFVKK